MMTDRDAASEDIVPVGMYTETLARLYMRQGHVNKALQIYRYLAAQQPSNLDLQDQIRALEHRLTLATDRGPDAAVPALPIPVDGPVAQEAGAHAPSSVAQPSREVEQARHVIAHLERWLRALRRGALT